MNQRHATQAYRPTVYVCIHTAYSVSYIHNMYVHKHKLQSCKSRYIPVHMHTGFSCIEECLSPPKEV